jgi:hypothetical protein
MNNLREILDSNFDVAIKYQERIIANPSTSDKKSEEARNRISELKGEIRKKLTTDVYKVLIELTGRDADENVFFDLHQINTKCAIYVLEIAFCVRHGIARDDYMRRIKVSLRKLQQHNKLTVDQMCKIYSGAYAATSYVIKATLYCGLITMENTELIDSMKWVKRFRKDDYLMIGINADKFLALS